MGFHWVHLSRKSEAGYYYSNKWVVAFAMGLSLSGCLPGGLSSLSSSIEKVESNSSLREEASSSAPYTALDASSDSSAPPFGEKSSFQADSFLSPLAVGLQHTCFIGVDLDQRKSVFCSGLNEFEQIAAHSSEEVMVDSNESGISNKPLVRVLTKPSKFAIPAGYEPISVAVGFGHTCVLLTNGSYPSGLGKVFCRGQSDHGAISLSGLDNVFSLRARGQQSCALQRDASMDHLVCSGTRIGVLPDGKKGPIRYQEAKTLVANFGKNLVVGFDITAAHVVVATGFKVFGYGLNLDGQSGADRIPDSDVISMREVYSLSSTEPRFSRVQAQDDRTVLQRLDGSVEAFGRSLGDVNPETKLYEVFKAPYKAQFWKTMQDSLKSISASGAALSKNAEAYYGAYTYSPLGRPVKIAFDVAAIDYSEGDQNGCLLFNSGCVSCWGFNGFGQMGIDKVDYEERFMKNPAIQALSNQQCALKR